MKRTTQIAFGKQIFQIEEDGYCLLDEYLKNIEEHFRKDDPTGEIKQDFEERIMELFQEKIRLGHPIITKEIVMDVIGQVGDTDQLFDGEESFCKTEQDDSKANRAAGSTQAQAKPQKIFYRNPNDKMLAGVLGGMAAYMHIDSTILRLIYIVLLFSPIGLPLILCYIAFALFTRKATTVSERLEMSGEEVSPNSIWKKITEESHNIGDSISDKVMSLNEELNIQTKFNNTVQSISSSAKTFDWKKWIWIGLLLFLVAGLAIGAIFLFFPYLPANLEVGREIWRENILSGFNLLGGSGSTLLLVIPVVILIISIIFGAIFLIAILPIGIILKANLSPIAKALLTIGWFLLLYYLTY